MKIKIVRCPSQTLWYNSHVGEVFDSYREYEDSYLVRAPDNYSNIIYKCDAEVLETTKEV